MPATNRIHPPPFSPSSTSSLSIASHRSSIQIASPLGLLNLWYARCAHALLVLEHAYVDRILQKGRRTKEKLISLFDRTLLSHPLTQTLPLLRLCLFLAFISTSLVSRRSKIPSQTFRDFRRYYLLKLIYFARENKVGERERDCCHIDTARKIQIK